MVLCYVLGAVAIYAEETFRAHVEKALAALDPLDPEIVDRVHAVPRAPDPREPWTQA